jgi:hypothetical protein
MASNQTPDTSSARPQQEIGRLFHTIGRGAGPVTVPFAAAALQPVLGVALLAAELVFILIVFGIVVYGTHEQADRVFRLLRWLRSRPEPSAPITLQAKDPAAQQPAETGLATKDSR